MDLRRDPRRWTLLLPWGGWLAFPPPQNPTLQTAAEGAPGQQDQVPGQVTVCSWDSNCRLWKDHRRNSPAFTDLDSTAPIILRNYASYSQAVPAVTVHLPAFNRPRTRCPTVTRCPGCPWQDKGPSPGAQWHLIEKIMNFMDQPHSLQLKGFVTYCLFLGNQMKVR